MPFWNIAFTNSLLYRVCTTKKRTYFVIGHATFSPHQATFLRLEHLRKLVYNQNHKVTRQHETASLSAPHTAPTGRVSLWLCSFSPVFFSFLTAHPSLIIICSPPCPVWQVLFRPVIYKFSQSSQKGVDLICHRISAILPQIKPPPVMNALHPITQCNLCLNFFRLLIPALLSGARLMNPGLLTFKPSGQTVTTWCSVLWLPARTSSPASPLTGTL